MFVRVVEKDLSAIQNSVNTCWKLHSKSPYVPEEMPNKVMITLYVHSWLASIEADSWWGMPSYAFLLLCYIGAWLEPICFPQRWGRVGEHSAQSFAAGAYAPGKRKLNPRRSLRYVCFPFLLKCRILKIALKFSSFCSSYCSGFMFTLWQADVW